ncbi:hypothetical protein CW731_11270 [Polaribacter sp. ALD11]|uniref:hypothetical protein n=1 Tax=Polaribacter sp. ALD11 TaxID=2058137 RepID=UPI000C30F741|nr:hypothetical protein [Polaribacter sp. ALD11]AUC85832.1 hypothetical protein CW731_11270 [Polaribacter sp. ALD11]
MRKVVLLLISIILFSSCLNDDEPNFTYDFLKIDSAETPDSFTFGKTDTIKIKYTLPNKCYSFSQLYYQYKDSTRVVAVTALVNLDDTCAEVTKQEEYSFPVKATQKKDYVFKFFKGKDADGESIFDEVIIPVN